MGMPQFQMPPGTGAGANASAPTQPQTPSSNPWENMAAMQPQKQKPQSALKKNKK